MDNQDRADSEFVRLLQLARSGDKDAVGHLLLRHRKLLLKIAHEEVGSDLRGKDGDSDVVQEVSIKALAGFGEFHGETDEVFKHWLKTILGNVLRDHRDHHYAKKRDRRLERPIHDIQNDSQNSDLANSDLSPSEVASLKEDRARFERAIQELPELDRTIVEMRYKEHYSIPEIASRLEMTERTTEYRWLVAVKEIRQKVRPNHEPAIAL